MSPKFIFIPSSAPAGPYLYDTYPAFYGVSAARQLKSGIPNIEELRRASDNDEVNVAFDSGEKTLNSLVTGGSTLGTWSTGTDAFSVKPYDQSGNGIVLEQNTGASQPKSITAGSLVTLGPNNKPSWDNSSTLGWKSTGNVDLSSESEVWMFIYMQVNNLNANRQSIFRIRDNINWANGDILFDFNNSSIRIGVHNGTTFVIDEYSTFPFVGDYYLTVRINLNVVGTGVTELWINSVSQLPTSQQPNILTNFGNRPFNLLVTNADGNPLNSKFSEFNLYTGNQSSNRTSIESNLTSFYG